MMPARTDEAVRDRLALTRAAYAELLASARAAVAAERDHAPDPLACLRGVLAEHGQLPPGRDAPGAAARGWGGGDPAVSVNLREEIAAVRGELGRVDAKCATLAGLTGAAAAFAAVQAAGHAPVAARAVTVAAGLTFTASALVLLLVLRPTLGAAGFCRWAALSADEIESGAAQHEEDARLGGVAAISAARLARAEAAELLRVLSVIAVTKYRRLRLAADLAAAGVALLAAAAVAGMIA